jgi:hypothetical protein
MRTTLFLSSLFAVTLLSGAALADKSVDRLRSHGDTVDKSYKHAQTHQASKQATGGRTSFTKTTVNTGNSRMNCSESGADCSSSKSASRSATTGASQSGHASQPPAFLRKLLGNDRTSFNEAGESNGMSARAANRVWSHSGAGQAGATMPLAKQTQRARGDAQASSVRMSCNEADECTASSKAVKKEWAYTAVKAGTWAGPVAKQPTNAERGVAKMKAERDQTIKH